jgi:hypothetical protein
MRGSLPGPPASLFSPAPRRRARNAPVRSSTLALTLAAGNRRRRRLSTYRNGLPDPRASNNGLHVVLVPNGRATACRLLLGGAHRQPRRGRARALGLRAPFRAHDVPAPSAIRGRCTTAHTSLGANTNATPTDDYNLLLHGTARSTCRRDRAGGGPVPETWRTTCPRSRRDRRGVRRYRKNPHRSRGGLDEASATRPSTSTYKHTTIGFERDVAAMPTMFDYSKGFFARFYRPENVVIGGRRRLRPKATLAETARATRDGSRDTSAPRSCRARADSRAIARLSLPRAHAADPVDRVEGVWIRSREPRGGGARCSATCCSAKKRDQRPLQRPGC